MLPLDLFPSASLRLDDFVPTRRTAVALLSATSPTGKCPRCGAPSDRVHSRYRRTVADLPFPGRSVALRLVVRKFRCLQPDCPRRIFCERLPDFLRPHARSTNRLTQAHRDIGLALGGEAGSRLADRLDMSTSPDTLPRRVSDVPDQPLRTPRAVGVDDWAICKGQRYGTILVDLEGGAVLDLLLGRDGEALTTWLKEHPAIEVLRRDRWAPYAQAAAVGAPPAQQVADRWHLLKNLREMVERLFGRCAAQVRVALHETPTPGATTPPPPGSPPAVEKAAGEKATASPPAIPPPPAAATPRQQARQAKRQQRAERHRQVRDLRAQGLSLRHIAQQVGLGVKAVRRYVRAERCPDWNSGRQPPTQVDVFASFIDAWVAQGGRNAAALYRELVAQGVGRAMTPYAVSCGAGWGVAAGRDLEPARWLPWWPRHQRRARCPLRSSVARRIAGRSSKSKSIASALAPRCCRKAWR